MMEQQPKTVSKPTSSSTDLQKVLEALTSQSEQMKRLEQSAGIQSERMKRLEEENNELKLHLAGLESRKNKRRQSGPEREIRQVPNPNDHERNPNGDKVIRVRILTIMIFLMMKQVVRTKRAMMILRRMIVENKVNNSLLRGHRQKSLTVMHMEDKRKTRRSFLLLSEWRRRLLN